jgi:hypothetical protein
MLRAGVDRVAGIVIAIAVTNPNNPNNDDKREAIESAAEIENFARRTLGLGDERIKRIMRNCDLIGDWTDLLPTAAEIAAPLRATILFNITGGRTPVTIASIAGRGSVPDGVHVDYLTIGIVRSTHRLVQLDSAGGFDQAKGFRETPLPPGPSLSLKETLLLYGIEPINEQKSWKP